MAEHGGGRIGWSEAAMERALAEVTRRASSDRGFRDLALRDPAEALRLVNAPALPPGFVMRFVDNDGANMTVVLPDLMSSSELSDEALGTVTGGVSRVVGLDTEGLGISRVVRTGPGIIRN